MKQDWASGKLETVIISCWLRGTSWLTVIRSQQLNSHVFTDARTLYLKRTPSLRLLSTMLQTGSGHLGSNLTGGCHYGSSAWGLSPSFTKWWLVGFTRRFASLPTDLAGGRLANTLPRAHVTMACAVTAPLIENLTNFAQYTCIISFRLWRILHL